MTHLGVHSFCLIAVAIHELFLRRVEHLEDRKVRLLAISLPSLWAFERGLSIGIILLYGIVPSKVSQWAEKIAIITFMRASVLHSTYFSVAFGRTVTFEGHPGFSFNGAALWFTPLLMRDKGSPKFVVRSKCPSEADDMWP